MNKNIEYHILGNHLFENAKALIFAGCFFSGPESDKWLQKGLKIIDKEIDEQILSDGANFELSPMYHNIILFDILNLYNLAVNNNNTELNKRKDIWHRLAIKMLNFSEAMCHPDGDVSFFNDSSIGIAPSFKFLKHYAESLGINSFTELNNDQLKLRLFDKAGYAIIESSFLKAILDVAKVGPDYIPGHGHADTLSFELSLFGHRVFVNSGTSEYGLTKERLRQRQTAAHNTIEVDGEDSSEVWGGFRVARRAYPSTPIINQSKNDISISCSHNGYKRLSGKVTHKRTWSFKERAILIEINFMVNIKKPLLIITFILI
ncbi:heparinase II/III domain-containing protein [Photobacterium leiognathi]|uniref:heparinase II/III domain-containing protein n=1 Tax=Photobacterium leiognathi TaxID=553611 RepID=UPI003DA10A4F